jgi:hypothetical protein
MRVVVVDGIAYGFWFLVAGLGEKQLVSNDCFLEQNGLNQVLICLT